MHRGTVKIGMGDSEKLTPSVGRHSSLEGGAIKAEELSATKEGRRWKIGRVCVHCMLSTTA